MMGPEALLWIALGIFALMNVIGVVLCSLSRSGVIPSQPTASPFGVLGDTAKPCATCEGYERQASENTWFAPQYYHGQRMHQLYGRCGRR